jgi:hypothetical protein
MGSALFRLNHAHGFQHLKREVEGRSVAHAPIVRTTAWQSVEGSVGQARPTPAAARLTTAGADRSTVSASAGRDVQAESFLAGALQGSKRMTNPRLGNS